MHVSVCLVYVKEQPAERSATLDGVEPFCEPENSLGSEGLLLRDDVGMPGISVFTVDLLPSEELLLWRCQLPLANECDALEPSVVEETC